jgi:hypothetical protein
MAKTLLKYRYHSFIQLHFSTFEILVNFYRISPKDAPQTFGVFIFGG